MKPEKKACEKAVKTEKEETVKLKPEEIEKVAGGIGDGEAEVNPTEERKSDLDKAVEEGGGVGGYGNRGKRP